MRKEKLGKKIWYYLFIIVAAFILGFIHYLQNYFNSTSLEQLLYTLLNMDNLNIVSLGQSIQYVVSLAIILIAIFFLPLFIPYFTKKEIKFKLVGKEITIFPVPLKQFSILLLVVAMGWFFLAIGTPDYLIHHLSVSSIYEDYYVPYEHDMVTFPEDKQNLIYIFVESFENSIFRKKVGGTVEKSYAPNLEELALKGINFSNTDQLGGFKSIPGTNWTVAGMVSQTAGIPIYIQTKNKDKHFLEGAVSLGEILEEHGYQNYLMIGSDANFGNRRQYFTEHGNYHIFDYNSARNNRDIPYDYFVWWGYEDHKLYDLAKKDLLEIAANKEPFNFTMLTADTHFFDGYTDASCPNQFSDTYANSYYCMDRMLSDFLNWIEQQDFYSNTTIVIAGDHLSMRDDFYSVGKDYDRTVFNLFLNAKTKAKAIKNRDFTAFDMFPTTLAALGADIQGERLALGTNLFSDQNTLSEELGYMELAKEVRKRSKYYQNKILK